MDGLMDMTGPSYNGDEMMGTFETQMKEICTMTVDMFNSEPDVNGIVGSTEAALVYEAEAKVMLKRKQAKEMVDLARNELRDLARMAQKQKLLATRPATVASALEVETRLANAQASRVADMKSNVEAEQKLYRMQAELDKLRAEIKAQDEEEVWEENELNSEVLRLKMYRGFGFTPVPDEDGTFHKVLVRSSTSKEAHAVVLDGTKDNFHYATILWDMLDR